MKTVSTASFLKKISLLGLLFLLKINGLWAQNQLAVNIHLTPPYPSNIEDLIDRIFFTVNNNTGLEYNGYFILTLNGTAGQAAGIHIDNALSAGSASVPIPATASTWNWETLESDYDGYGEDDFDIVYTPSQRALVVGQRKLPPGDYQVCVEIRENGTNLPLSMVACLTFTIVYYNPPQLILPPDDGSGSPILENEDDAFDIRWNPDAASIGQPGIEYTVEIRRFINAAQAGAFNSGGRQQDLMEGFELVREITGVTDLLFSTIDENLGLESHDIIAIRVRAEGPGIDFLNSGFSNIVLGFYGGLPADQCDVPAITVSDLVFPIAGDTLPFISMPTVLYFEPPCPNLLQMESDLEIIDQTTGATVSQHRDNNWRSSNGPINWLRNYINSHGGNLDYWMPQISYAGFLNAQNATPGTADFHFQRGHSYRNQINSTFTYRRADTGAEVAQPVTFNDLAISGFTVGMPQPILLSPENGATEPPGPVELRLRTGRPPTGALVPPIKVLNVEGHVSGIQKCEVKEKIVVEVSTDRTFSAPAQSVYCELKKIQASSWNATTHFNENNPAFEPMPTTNDFYQNRMIDEASLSANVFKELNFQTTDLAEGTYFWRAGWLRNPEAVNDLHPCSLTATDFYWFSPVSEFTIGEGDLTDENEELPNYWCDNERLPGEGGPAAPPPPPSDCDRACNVDIAAFSTTPLGDLLAGQTVRAGTFDVRIVEVTERGGDGRFSGTGTVLVKVDPAAAISLNLNVEFENARFNTARQLLDGEMTAVRDNIGAATSWISRNIGGIARTIPNFPTGEQANLAFSAIDNVSRLLSAAGGGPVNLPFGIDLSDGQDFRLVASLDNLVLRATGARGKYLLGVKLPESLSPDLPALMFGADQVCFSPDGPRGESRYFLANDLQIGPDGGWQVVLNGATSADNATHIEFDCNGFKAFYLKGQVRFHRDALIPETAEGVRTTGTEQVAATLMTRILKDSSFILGINFEQPFQFTVVPDFGMTVRSAYLDFSEAENPPAMEFPPTYNFDFIHAGSGTTAPAARFLNAWTGFYLAELAFRLPRSITEVDGRRIELAIRNFIFDAATQDISGAISIGPIFSTSAPGRVGDWALTMDRFEIGIVQSERAYGSLRGRIGLPILAASDFLRYTATLSFPDGEADFQFNIQPDPTGVRIPMWEVATITLAPTTFVRIAIGHAPEFAFELTGNIDFEGSTSTGVALDFPRIAVERLRYSTRDSEFRGALLFGGQRYAFGQASPQKNMSGMPISLEGISIAAVGGLNVFNLRFDLRLELGENLAVEANPGFRFNLGRTGGPDFQRFEVEAFLMPDEMCLETNISGVTLAGCIRHCQEGGTERFVGQLRIGIPSLATIELYADFGNYKNPSRPDAEFNTADNFNFFAFEGSVRLSTGITLFSGVALYGLGGGLSYNMTRTGDAIPIPAAPTAAGGDGGAPPASAPLPRVGCQGGRYTPRFGPTIGFMFSVYLGDNAGGNAYNLDITISAEMALRRDGSVQGFNRVTLCGNLSVFSSIGASTSGAALTACVLIQYTKNEGYEGIDGLIGVSLNLGPLHGCGAGGKMVDAAFHSDNTGMWYFHMGRPPEGDGPPCGGTASGGGGAGGASPCGSCRLTDGRAQATGPAGLQINLGIINVEIATYFMIGKCIPDLPPLPAAIQNLFTAAADERPENAMNNSETNSRRERAPAFADTGMEEGDGFAHGLQLHVGMNLNFIIFYANLDMWMGYDINVRQYTTECSGGTDAAGRPISHRIGMDGWFAKGQAYVGMRGEFGLGVDLPFLQAKIPILQAQAVVALRAEFPNPEWFSGRAAMSYSILNGSITGRCDFQFEMGARCINPNYDPLEGFEFITDVKPEGSGASVFSKAGAAFSMRMGQPFEVRDERTATQANPAGNLKAFRPEFQRLVVERSSDGAMALYDPARLIDGNYGVEATPQVWLSGGTGYRVTAEVVVYERLVDGSWRLFRKPNGDVWTDAKTRNFTTAARPQTVPPEQVRRSWPLHNQRFFLPGESMRIDAVGDEFCRPHQKGWLDLRTAMPELFNRMSNNLSGSSERTYTYEARILPMRGGAVLHRSPIEMTAGGRSVSWNMPNSLPPSQLLCVQLVRVPHNPYGISPTAVAQDVGFTDGGSAANRVKVLTLNNLIAGNTSNAQLNERRLTGERAADGAFVIYNFYFKTSRYQTMQEKLTAASVVRSALGSGGSNADIFLQAPEGFERYDYHGLWSNGVNEVQPLVHFDHQFGASFAPAAGASYLITDGTGRVKTDLFDFMNNLPHMTFRHDFTGLSTIAPTALGIPLSMPSATVFNNLCIGGNCQVVSQSGQIIRARYRALNGYIAPATGIVIRDFEEPLSRDEIEGSDAPPGTPMTAAASATASAQLIRNSIQSGTFSLGGGPVSGLQAVTNTAPAGNIRLNNNLPGWWEFVRMGSDDHILRIENRIARAISPSVAGSNMFNTENYGNVWSKMQYVAHPTQPFSLSSGTRYRMAATYWCPTPSAGQCRTTSTRNFEYTPR